MLSLSSGYTPLNTLIFSVIGILIYLFPVNFYLTKLRKINIDFEFVKCVVLFAVIGGFLRLLSQDYSSIGGLIKTSSNPLTVGFYFQYPYMFILLGFLFLLSFELSLFLSRQLWSTSRNYYKILKIIALSILLPLLVYSFACMTLPIAFLLILLGSFLVFFIVKFVSGKLLKDKTSQITVFSQVLDGTATFSAITFFQGVFREEHVLPGYLLAVNPLLFLVVKVVIVLLFVYTVDKLVKKEERRYYKLFVVVLGLVTGVRDLLTIATLG